MCRLNCELSDSFYDNRLKTSDHCSNTIILNDNSSCISNNHHFAANHSTNAKNNVENHATFQIQPSPPVFNAENQY